jgi:outer membrane protein TolC
LSRAQLTTAIGISSGNEFDPSDILAERNFPATSLEEVEKQGVEMRPDLKRVRSEEAAQQQSVSIAKSSFGPLLPRQSWYRRERRLKTAETKQLKWIAIVFLASLTVRNFRRRQS